MVYGISHEVKIRVKGIIESSRTCVNRKSGRTATRYMVLINFLLDLYPGCGYYIGKVIIPYEVIYGIFRKRSGNIKSNSEVNKPAYCIQKPLN